jgi:DNA-directed RNA polymerase subunit M/transcription elongation factor TFIIS
MWKRLSGFEMKLFLVIICDECGGLLLAKTEHKTRKCPYCGSRVNVEKAKKVASAENAQNASTILQEMKRRKGAEEHGFKRLKQF